MGDYNFGRVGRGGRCGRAIGRGRGRDSAPRNKSDDSRVAGTRGLASAILHAIDVSRNFSSHTFAASNSPEITNQRPKIVPGKGDSPMFTSDLDNPKLQDLDQMGTCARQAAIIEAQGAQYLADNAFVHPVVGLPRDEYMRLARRHNESAQVFYLSRYFSPNDITPLLTQVPAVCVDGDSHIVLQSGEVCSSLDEANALVRKKAVASTISPSAPAPALLTTEQRRLARNKCVASKVTVLAQGGYHEPLKRLRATERFDCVVVTGAGPQFESSYLDYADFILSSARTETRRSATETADGVVSNRLQAFTHLGPQPPQSWSELKACARSAAEVVEAAKDLSRPLDEIPRFVFLEGTAGEGLVLDARALMESLMETVHLWLTAFDSSVAAHAAQHASKGLRAGCSEKGAEDGTPVSNSRARGYFKLTAIGSGFFASLPPPNQVNIGRIVQPLLLRAVMEVLRDKSAAHLYSNIGAIEFPDFSGEELYTPDRPKMGRIHLVSAPRVSALDFDPEVRRWENGWVPGVLNPGDCFSLVGNELSHASVEAMIACNSTLRVSQNYIWNDRLLDQKQWKAVQHP